MRKNISIRSSFSCCPCWATSWLTLDSESDTDVEIDSEDDDAFDPVSFERLIAPIRLPCGHHINLDTVLNMADKSLSLRCPLDRAPFSFEFSDRQEIIVYDKDGQNPQSGFDLNRCQPIRDGSNDSLSPLNIAYRYYVIGREQYKKGDTNSAYDSYECALTSELNPIDQAFINARIAEIFIIRLSNKGLNVNLLNQLCDTANQYLVDAKQLLKTASSHSDVSIVNKSLLRDLINLLEAMLIKGKHEFLSRKSIDETDVG